MGWLSVRNWRSQQCLRLGCRPWRVALLLALALFALLVGRPYPTERLALGHVESTRYVDSQGRLLYERRSEAGGYGRPVALDAIAPEVLWATLASEDRFFYLHPGIDPVGMARALWLNARRGRWAFGGSTLTQQLGKLIDPEPRTLAGKAREAIDALRLELTLSKREILEQYLNRAYYGRQSTGIEAAARRYFGKSARELTLAESVLLAIQPRSPSRYDPERHPEAARQRSAHVLGQMVERGFISEADASQALEAPIDLIDPRQSPSARHALDRLLTAAPGRSGVIRTSLDLDLQAAIERRLDAHLEDLVEQGASQGGVVVLDNASGDVLVMVGSRDYQDAHASGAVNATTARRPPGSTLKPLLYALSLERGSNASTPLLDVPTELDGYRPRAASGRHWGLVSQRDALGSSMNAPAVRLLDELGSGGFAELLHRLELHADPAQHWLSLALGGTRTRLVDLANAYATLARGGLHLPWRLTQSDEGGPGRQVLDPRAAYVVLQVLSDPAARQREFGPETPLDFGFPVAVKTGTSQSFCDNLTIGVTPEITVAAWVGNFDGTPLRGLLAMHGAAPLWRDAMRLAMERRLKRAFSRPPGLDELEVCPVSGLPRGPHCPQGRAELVFQEHAADDDCDWHRADGLHVPGELIARTAIDAAGALERDDVLVILSPPDGSEWRIDPLIPAPRQRMPLEVDVGSNQIRSVRWRIDGIAVATVGAPFAASWPLSPGTHRVEVEAGLEDGTTARRGVQILVRSTHDS